VFITGGGQFYAAADQVAQALKIDVKPEPGTRR
jgi:hypothetical protein